MRVRVFVPGIICVYYLRILVLALFGSVQTFPNAILLCNTFYLLFSMRRRGANMKTNSFWEIVSPKIEPFCFSETDGDADLLEADIY